MPLRCPETPSRAIGALSPLIKGGVGGVFLLLAGCAGSVREQDGFPTAVPENLQTIPDAQPMAEPKSRYGNPPSYEIAGGRYFVLNSATGYRERGDASWYGTKFHGRRTSSGEPYDMFGMTAAHKTLPLPTYVRVTRLDNGKNVVVRVNDRGPFHAGRIIDLSYAAAAKLELLGQGSARVEVEALNPEIPLDTHPPTFLEIGTTEDPILAVALREAATDLGFAAVEIRSEEHNDRVWHRVLVGPFRDRTSLDTARERLIAGEHPVKPVRE